MNQSLSPPHQKEVFNSLRVSMQITRSIGKLHVRKSLGLCSIHPKLKLQVQNCWQISAMSLKKTGQPEVFSAASICKED